MEHLGAWMRHFIIATLVLGSLCWRPDANAAERDITTPFDSTRASVFSAFPLGGTPRRTWIAPALVANFYNHQCEHAPPRQPGGVMQRREHYYQAPPEPFVLLCSQLGPSNANQRLASDLVTLRANWQQGRDITDNQITSLRADAIASSVPYESLLDAARSIQWLVSERVAEVFFAAGLEKALPHLDQIRLDDSRRTWLLHTIDQTACCWNSDDNDALIARFTIARRLTPRLSIESRRAGYLLSEALLANDLRNEAADLILSVQREHAEAGDLGHYEAEDLPEMDFVTGYILFHAGRYDEAIEHLTKVDGEHLSRSNLLLFESFIRTSRFDQARAMIMDGGQQNPTPLVPERPLPRLIEEVNRARWAAEIGQLNTQSPTNTGRFHEN